ncbi:MULTISPECIES: hypothetical protein [unclassified Acinetobacter]|uniref:hypothetical protein n=1 Tax=unclassified Acinetobacter TaxID=196816 RepID=UPI00190D84A4|nr:MULTISPECIES: hypothetical protein [unclassified Acinetobacter]MBK0062184.1 hypothetical protein [Acinetobacter sp. S55]MBK0065988.1 hypothetical protein [Acinetobacter sp. S54]
MQKKHYTTPFEEYMGKDSNGYYTLRLGPKIYMVRVSENYTPNFDNEFFGGRSERAFDWHTILVKDKTDSEPRSITEDELTVKWLKPSIKKVVNYQRAIKRRVATQSPRYSKEQCIAYRNKQYNNA